MSTAKREGQKINLKTSIDARIHKKTGFRDAGEHEHGVSLDIRQRDSKVVILLQRASIDGIRDGRDGFDVEIERQKEIDSKVVNESNALQVDEEQIINNDILP